MSFELERSCAFIEEYIHHRNHYRWHFFKVFVQFTNTYMVILPFKREQECWELIDKIKHASTAADIIALIDLTGERARKAQALKEETKGWAGLKGYNRFIEDNSLYAKLNHAVRTSLVNYLNTSTMKKEFFEEIAGLKKKLDTYQDEINSALDNSEMIAANKLKRKNVLIQLLDRQDEETWKMVLDRDQERYLEPYPMYEPGELILPPPNPNRPTVYNDNYDKMYLNKEIQLYGQRKDKFNEFLRKLLREKEPGTIALECFDEALDPIAIHSLFSIINNQRHHNHHIGSENNNKSTAHKLKRA